MHQGSLPYCNLLWPWQLFVSVFISCCVACLVKAETGVIGNQNFITFKTKKMKKIMIAIIVIAIAATGSYFYFTNSKFKNAANQFVEKNITGKDAVPPATSIKYLRDVYYVADGTGSGYTQYLVPKIEIPHLNRMADSIHWHGGGRLWLRVPGIRSKRPALVSDVGSATYRTSSARRMASRPVPSTLNPATATGLGSPQ